MAAHGSTGASDVVIIGGGITGLYTAWRLANSTNLKILVLEATKRLGGRFMTCEMPGGFTADLGAMRYLPSCQPIMVTLLKQLGVKTNTLMQGMKSQNHFKYFFRNKRMNSLEEFRAMFSLSDDELPILLTSKRLDFADKAMAFEFSKGEDESFETAVFVTNGQQAKDITLGQYMLSTNNVELLNISASLYPPSSYPISVVEGVLGLITKNWHKVGIIEGGYEAIVNSIISALASFPNVEMKCGQKVGAIAQHGTEFLVTSMEEDERRKYLCQKVIYACSSVGLDSIMLEGQPKRQALLKELTSKITMLPAFKLYLTYNRPWWEDCGIFEGRVVTDLPNHNVMTFGEAGKSEYFATLLATYAYDNLEIFQSLDLDTHERFTNVAGSVSSDLIPSKVLVDHVHNTLKHIMGYPDLMEKPVCAVRMFWGAGSKGGMLYYPKCGVNSNQLHWDSLKPFDDAEIYISGDTFTAWVPNGVNLGFAEAPLLASERILTNYFSLEPFVDGLCLQNPWPVK